MAGDGGGGGTRELDQTPTWAVAAVCAVIVAASILLEGLLHHLSQWFSKRRKKALFDALEKVKSGIATIAGRYIARICIPAKAADTMLPCRLSTKSSEAEHEKDHRRHLSSDPISFSYANPNDMTGNGAAHFSRRATPAAHLRVLLGRLPCRIQRSYNVPGKSKGKTRIWKEWEREASSPTYEFSNDPTTFRFTHQTSFVRQHASCWSKITVLLYVVSFFRQFFRSVRKTDYLTLRHGFIAAHLSPGTRFNFRKYIKRSLEDDFKTVVGISPPLWASALAVMLFNVQGWQNLFWFSTVPLIVILAVGTKLQAIIARMAIEIKERHTVIQGIPLVKLSDEHFWLRKPYLVLGLIHFASFQNAFEITYFFWIWYEFGLRSCFHESFELIIARVCLGAAVQFLCSYITLPLYALVSQMGSQMKKTIFDEQTARALKKWRKAVVKKKQQKEASQDPPKTLSINTEANQCEAPVRHLHRYKTIGHTGATRSLSDTDFSDTDTEMSSQTRHLIPPTKQRSLESGRTEVRVDIEAAPTDQDSFSFPKVSTQNVQD